MPPGCVLRLFIHSDEQEVSDEKVFYYDYTHDFYYPNEKVDIHNSYVPMPLQNVDSAGVCNDARFPVRDGHKESGNGNWVRPLRNICFKDHRQGMYSAFTCDHLCCNNKLGECPSASKFGPNDASCAGQMRLCGEIDLQGCHLPRFQGYAVYGYNPAQDDRVLVTDHHATTAGDYQNQCRGQLFNPGLYPSVRMPSAFSQVLRVMAGGRVFAYSEQNFMANHVEYRQGRYRAPAGFEAFSMEVVGIGNPGRALQISSTWELATTVDRCAPC